MSWECAPFASVVRDATGGNPKIQKKDYLSAGLLPVIDQNEGGTVGYTNDESAACRVQLPVVLFGDHTRVIKYVDYPFALGADGVKVLKPTEVLDERFLAHYLATHKPPSAGYSRHFKFLKTMQIPIPPREEQHRVAELLDESDRLLNLRAEANEKAQRLLSALFMEMFGDPEVNPMGWDSKSIDEVASIITGNTPSRKVAAYYAHDIEWIKPGNLGGAPFRPTRAAEWLSEDARAVARIAPRGATLVTCIAGSLGSVGKASMLDREAAFNQQINALVAKDGISPAYLFGLIRTSPQIIRGAAAQNMQFIVSKSRMAQVRVPVPPAALQERFALLAEGVGHIVSDCELLHQKSMHFDSILSSRLFAQAT